MIKNQVNKVYKPLRMFLAVARTGCCNRRIHGPQRLSRTASTNSRGGGGILSWLWGLSNAQRSTQRLGRVRNLLSFSWDKIHCLRVFYSERFGVYEPGRVLKFTFKSKHSRQSRVVLLYFRTRDNGPSETCRYNFANPSLRHLISWCCGSSLQENSCKAGTVVSHRLGRKYHRLGHHFSWFSPHWVTF